MAAGDFSFLGNKFLVHPKTDSVHGFLGLVAASADGSASAPGEGGKDDLLAQPEHAKIPANKKNRSVFILEKDLGQGYQDLQQQLFDGWKRDPLMQAATLHDSFL